MPAQKRPYEADDVTPPTESEDVDDTPGSDSHEQLPENDPAEAEADADAAADGSESDRSRSSTDGEMDEEVAVKLSDIRKEVQCPICLGIIRKTRTVMECLHRFCRECIDKAMRMGNNECPACRTHCASRRSLRDDLNYDAIIAALYPDLDKYEEEELAFQEEEAARNKQIQATIAQTFRRQTEALGRKRRSQVRHRDTPLRVRRKYRATEPQGSDNEDAHGDAGKDSSSADERSMETRPKRSKRWPGVRFSHPSSANAGAGGGGTDHCTEVNRESIGVSAGLIGPSELVWGRGGIRSHTRYGSLNGGNGKNIRNSRISKMVDHLRHLEGKDAQLDVHLLLVSFDEQIIPRLQKPCLCCKPTLLVRHLCEYVAQETAVQGNEIVIYSIKELQSEFDFFTSTNSQSSKSTMFDPSNLQVVDEQETLAGLTTQNFTRGQLLLVYKKLHRTESGEKEDTDL